MTRRLPVCLCALWTIACGPEQHPESVRDYGYEVVHTYPHDATAFTEGLLFHEGFLYESTGLYEQSSIRKVKLESGEIIQRRDLPGAYFGEGIAVWKDRLVQLTYQSGKGFVYNLASFAPQSDFTYPGVGWALTSDEKRLIMSDGTPELRFLDPDTLRERGRLLVTDGGSPVKYLNELEWYKGAILANVWHSDRIARIDPATGRVTAWIDCSGLLPPRERPDPEDVLNGIAWDAANDRVFITGKRWPRLFEIRLVVR
jgi:glutaminyl-peptide cyclotransferase